MKSYKAVILHEAKFDIKEIKLGYSLISPNLASRFSNDLKNTFISIKRTPMAYAKRFSNIRFANLDIFPFIIEFLIDKDDLIIIVAVLYNGRNPDFFKNRSQIIG